MSDDQGGRAGAAELELTARALLVGLGLGAMLAVGNVYAGLKTSWWDSGNVTAALLGFAIVAPGARLRRRPYSLLENNVTQTAAGSAAIMPPAIGLLGAVPALQLLGHHHSLWAIGVWGLAVALFGILLAVPLRRRYVVSEPLPFPSAIATAQVIRAVHASSGEARRHTRALFATVVVALLVTWFRDGRPALLPGTLWMPVQLAGVAAATFTLGIGVSPLLIGAGVLAGPRNGLSMLAGAVLAWAVIAPALVRAGMAGADYQALVAWLLWPGVAAMVAAGLVGLVARWRSFARAIVDVGRLGAGAQSESRRFWTALLLAGLAVVALSWAIFGVHPAWGAIALLLAALLIDVCVRTAGETDIAPLGALGQLVQLVFGLVAPGPAPANVACGAVTAGGGAQSSLTVNVLKAGHLLGATPRAQLRAQALGAVVGAMVALPVYALFTSAHRLGGTSLPAPGALGWKALAVLAETGTAALPSGTGWACAAAAVLGAALALLERTRAAPLVPSPTALGVAFLLPATTSVTIAIGSMLLLLVRRRGAAGEPLAASMAAGGIAGEALAGLVIAILIATRVLS